MVRGTRCTINHKTPKEILRTSSSHALQTDSLGSRSDNSGKTTVTNWSSQAAGGGGGLAAGGGGGSHAGLAPSPSLPGSSISSPTKPRMEVVCVIDLHLQQHLQDRRKAFEEVKFACAIMGQHNVQVSYPQLQIKLSY